MPFMSFSNINLSNLEIVPKIPGPEFTASELAVTNNAAARAFGYAMSSDSTRVAVGAYSASKAFVYEFDGVAWNKTAEWTKTGRFGYKVAIDGEWAAVANTPTSGNGSVFLYRRVNGTWQTTEHTILNTPDAALGNGFASSVSLHNGTLVVGHTKAGGAGGVHVYVWDGSTWTKQGPVLSVSQTMARAASSQNLGGEVSVYGDILVAGGSGDTLGKGAGMAFYCKRTNGTWSTPKLMSPETTYFDGYGWSVLVKGTKIIVGAPFGNTADKIPGRAFLYDVAGANPVLEKIFTVKTDKSETIQDPLSTVNDSYGWSVAINDNLSVIAIGSVNRNGGKGITYVYEKIGSVWGLSAIPDSWVTASNGATNNRFGSAVVFAQSGLLVGAFGLGAFYWFK